MTDQSASFVAEQSVVGALLLDNAAFDRLPPTLEPHHFADPLLRRVFVEARSQLLAGKPCDAITVHEALGDSVSLQQLGALAQFVPSGANLRRYSELMIAHGADRALRAAGGDIAELAEQSSRPIGERVEEAQGLLSKIAGDASRDEWVPAFDGMVAHTAVLEQRAEGKIKSWSTGLYGLDEHLEGGLRPGSLMVIGARPSMGKTAIGMTIGLHMAADYSIALMSMEMPHCDVRDRMVAMLGRVSLSDVIRPHRDHGLDWQRVSDGIDRAKTLNFFVSDQSALTINHIRAKARNVRRMHGLQVLIVDYLGLMVGTDPKQPRAYQIEEITKGLKQLAKDLDIAVIALAQLNRQIEQRANRRPMLGDFRDSGSIEQDADIVLGIHREFVDNPELKGEWTNYAELTILKNRQGRTGLVHLHYEGPHVRFTDWGGPVPQRAALRRRPGMEDQ